MVKMRKRKEAATIMVQKFCRGYLYEKYTQKERFQKLLVRRDFNLKTFEYKQHEMAARVIYFHMINHLFNKNYAARNLLVNLKKKKVEFLNQKKSR